MKKVLFTVRRRYFDAIVSGEKTEEIREHKPHWMWLLGTEPPQQAVFMCGRDIHRRHILNIYVGEAERVLGRAVSEQGRKDLNYLPGEYTKACIIIELGEAEE